MLFESLAIIEYLDETHPNPPLLPKEPKARARVRGLAQIIACDTHPLIVPRVREYLAHEYKVDEPGVHEMGPPLARRGAEGAGGAICRRRQGHRPLSATATRSRSPTSAWRARRPARPIFKVDLAPFPTVKRIVDDLHGDRRLRPRASAEAARRAGVGLTDAQHRDRRPRLVGQESGEGGARFRRTDRFARGVTLEPDTVRDFAAEYKIPIGTSFDEVLADPAVKAVVLATPHTKHPAQVEARRRPASTSIAKSRSR